MGLIPKLNELCGVISVFVIADGDFAIGSGVELCMGDMINDGSFTAAVTLFGVFICCRSSICFCFSSGKSKLKDCRCLMYYNALFLNNFSNLYLFISFQNPPTIKVRATPSRGKKKSPIEIIIPEPIVLSPPKKTTTKSRKRKENEITNENPIDIIQVRNSFFFNYIYFYYISLHHQNVVLVVIQNQKIHHL